MIIVLLLPFSKRKYRCPFAFATEKMVTQCKKTCDSAATTWNFNIFYVTETILFILQNGIKVGNLFEGKILVNASYGEWAVRFTAIGTCSLKVITATTVSLDSP